VQQPGIKAVAIKTEAQQAVLALHRMRQQLVKFRTAQINALRGLLGPGDVPLDWNLLRGKETSVHGDAGYIGADKRVAKKRGRDWFIAEKRGKVKATKDDELRDLLEQIEHKKASVRARVEHPFRIVKRQFGYFKVRYRGLAKNGAQGMTLFALANLWMARRTVLAATG
jgi:IS5 family transposase